MSHDYQANSSSPWRFEPPLLVPRSRFHDILRLWIHHGTSKTCPMMVTDNRASQCSLWNQMTTKHGYARIIPSDLAIFRHGGPSEVRGRAFRNSTLWPNQWGKTSSKSSSWRERNPRTASFIRAHQQASMPPVGVEKLEAPTKASTKSIHGG
jgi:hypothetical protein